SAASPLAAGIGALLLSINPGLTPAEVRTVLRNSSDKIGNLAYDQNGWNPSYGYGRLNAGRAIDDVKQTARADLTLNFASLPATVNYGNRLSYSIIVSNQGPTAAFGIFVTNLLPETIRFVSASRPL